MSEDEFSVEGVIQSVSMWIDSVEHGAAVGRAVNRSDLSVHLTFDVRFETADGTVVGMNGQQRDVGPGETIEWQLFMHGHRSAGVDRRTVTSGEIVWMDITLRPPDVPHTIRTGNLAPDRTSRTSPG